MSYRAAILLLQEDKVALIERQRAGLHYFTFPGGHVEEGETPEQAAVRETAEELGLQVVIKKLLARMGWQGRWQYYYLVEAVGGTFGTGTGEEMIASGPERGSYLPVWMPVDDLLKQPVLPHEMAELVASHVRDGWPAHPLIIPEQASCTSF
jgi:8-oxo-dGTP pyrophosphatase MutT (NUDIX family)